ncbi:uncharacterized protein LTR77_000588 [Saxophila tyrrhenica]|uniref:DNA-directed RNA polymerase III subunit RPC9 n=1 Tax=Saxophila tyrrhenica TaxID=1690608 RepID=A0AAV9PR21_9PEZI|nr:hypothetical protein LTR77_000588 [Saxophila tyrrhenica]
MVQILRVEGHLPNAEVLHHITTTRARHAREDDAAPDGKKVHARPANFLASLDKHERHLQSPHYPYLKNPSVYGTPFSQSKALRKLSALHMRRIQHPLYEDYMGKVQRGEINADRARKKLERLQERKELTDTEWLMIVNHAPVVLELLQPMVEDCDERFTEEEREILLQCVKDVLRKDEGKRGEAMEGVVEGGGGDAKKDG